MSTDVDIDFADREQILALIPHVVAMQRDGNKQRKHNTGVYFHHAPVNPFTGLATLDYKEAESKGWFKLDCLNVGIFSQFKNNDQIDALLEKQPIWELLEHDEVIKELFHIHNHADIVKKLKPRTVEQLAMVLAIIRPGKRHLLDRPWHEIEKSVWEKTDEKYFFKRSHAIAYAMTIILQLNLLAYGSEFLN